MGQTISSVTQMVSFAGDLRRQAKQATVPEHAEKLQRAAVNLETTALQKVGLYNPAIGKLLDILT
jgi:hypothetical protein